MTVLRQLVIDAFRESGIVQVGLTPEAEEFDEGLRKLQSFIESLYGNEVGVPLVSKSYGSYGVTNAAGLAADIRSEINGYYAPSNIRLVANVSQAETIYLEPNPEDGAMFAIIDAAGNFATSNVTIRGNGRKVEGGTSVVLSTNGASRRWLYRDDLAEWVRISNLDADSESPFPTEFDDFLIVWLAMRLNPRYQTQAAPESISVFKETKRKFTARYSQIRQVGSEAGLLRLSDYTGTDDNFDKGRID